VPPAGRRVAALELSLLPGPVPGSKATLFVNGYAAGVLESPDAPAVVKLQVPDGSWWRGPNRIDLAPSDPVADAGPFLVGRSGRTVPSKLLVESAGFHYGKLARMRAGKEEVSRKLRGYHLAVLSDDGRGIAAVRSFDTSADPEASAALATFVDSLAGGTVVLGAVADDASLSISERAVHALGTLGCAIDLTGRKRQSHAFIGVKGAARGSVPEWGGVTLGRVAVGPELLRVSRVRLLDSGEEAGRLRIDPDLPVSVDDPGEGQELTSPILVRGWCQDWGEGRVDVVAVRIDGEPYPLAGLVRVPRADVAKALPKMGRTEQAGYDLRVDVSDLQPGEHVLHVTFASPDGRTRVYEPRRFRLKR
jgi:hypothetical protein